MYEVEVHAAFSAAHAIRMRGALEELHGHDWQVCAVVAREELDEDGLVTDFHALQGALERILAPLRNRTLNGTPPFDRINPTAERVAEHIAHTLSGSLPAGVVLRSVRVTEAPGCAARVDCAGGTR